MNKPKIIAKEKRLIIKRIKNRWKKGKKKDKKQQNPKCSKDWRKNTVNDDRKKLCVVEKEQEVKKKSKKTCTKTNRDKVEK